MLYVIIYYTLLIQLIVVPIMFFIVKKQMAKKQPSKADKEEHIIKHLLTLHYDNLPPYSVMVTKAREKNFSSEFYDSLIAIYFQ